MNTIIDYMKRNYKILLVIACLSVTLLAFKINTGNGDETNPDKDKLLLELLTFVIEKGHYSPATIGDNFSKGVYKDYIEALDPSKRFFRQSDIDEFSKYETQLDNQLLNKDLTFFDLTYTRLIKRMEESKAIYKAILSKPFDYTIDESFNTDYENAPYAKSTAELNNRWRKQIKLSTLSSLIDRLDMQENKKKGTAGHIANDPINQLKQGEKIEESYNEKSKVDSAVDSGKPKTFEELYGVRHEGGWIQNDI